MTSRLHPVEFDWKSDEVADRLPLLDGFEAVDFIFDPDSPEVVDVEAEFFEEVPAIGAVGFESFTLVLLLEELIKEILRRNNYFKLI